MKTFFNQCCFCFSLETGGQIIGWLYAICGGLGFIGFVAAAILVGFIGDTGDVHIDKTLLVTVSVVMSIFSLINLVAGILLLRGISRKSHKEFIVILVLMVLGIISTFINFLLEVTAANVVSIIIGACLQVYFFLCILSLYNKIKNEGHSRPQQYA